MHNAPGRIGKFLTPGAAIRQIEASRVKYIYRETPALQLLGIVDELGARKKWCERTSREMDPNEVRTLDNAQDELVRRQRQEMAFAQEAFDRRNKIWKYFPDEGPLRRELYPRHMDFIRATATDDEVMFMAGNKVGKSLIGAYCATVWATGRYPDWWEGRVFENPTLGWIANKSAKDVRDINEAELLRSPETADQTGMGMIPGHLIQKLTPKPGVPGGFEFILVKHVSGGISTMVSKSYDQGRTAFQGRNIDFAWNDEEIDRDTYDEENMRVMVTRGLLITTYTPILGLTPMTVWFMESAGISIDDMKSGKEVDGEAE